MFVSSFQDRRLQYMGHPVVIAKNVAVTKFRPNLNDVLPSKKQK